MHLDVTIFHQFYQTILGGLVRRILTEKLDIFWSLPAVNDYISGIGYTEPFLEIYKTRGHKVLSMQSVYSGVYANNSNGMNRLLVDEHKLPLQDNSQTNILTVHLLEHTPSPYNFIRELSRVLSPDNGELILIIPNRRGLWARLENTPFGHGKPYSKKQLIELLESCNLFVKDYKTALFFPPREHPPLRLYVDFAEYIGNNSFLSYYGGVHIMKLVKYAYVPPKLLGNVSNSINIIKPNLSTASCLNRPV